MIEKKDEISFFSKAISFGHWLTKKDNYLASNFYEANGITIKWEKILQPKPLLWYEVIWNTMQGHLTSNLPSISHYNISIAE